LCVFPLCTALSVAVSHTALRLADSMSYLSLSKYLAVPKPGEKTLEYGG
jgi:hypothetical protein